MSTWLGLSSNSPLLKYLQVLAGNSFRDLFSLIGSSFYLSYSLVVLVQVFQECVCPGEKGTKRQSICVKVEIYHTSNHSFVSYTNHIFKLLILLDHRYNFEPLVVS